MNSAIARREKILEILSERRYEKMINLAQELKVTRRTIVGDIAVLSEIFPIYTETGTYGGVYVVDGFRHRMKYLSDSQLELLERLLETQEGKDKEVLHSIIKTFKKPECKNKGKK